MVDISTETIDSRDSSRSAVSWAAIIGGAVVGAAVGLLLFILGAGFGLLSVSPWGGGASPTAFGAGAAIWFVIVEWVSAAVGGYVAGRLRTKWVAVHTHEVFFRDTAHGLITWALSTIVVFALGAGSVGMILGGVTGAATSVASGAAQGAMQGAASAAPDLLNGGGGYFTDMLFRTNATAAAGSTAAPAATGTTAAPATDTAAATAPAATDTTAAAAGTTAAPAATATPDIGTIPMPGTTTDMTAMASSANATASRGEATTILAHSVAAGGLSDDDRAYLAQLVSAQTGLSPADAQTRVNTVMTQVQDVTTKAKAAVDAARKAAAGASLLFALSLLIGAFIASVAAAIGGSERDEAEHMVGMVVR